MIKGKLIGIAASPNTDQADRRLSGSLIFKPWRYYRGPALKELEDWFIDRCQAKFAVSFGSGRAGLYEILKGFGIGPGDDVIVPAFTCVAVPDAVLWSGAKPIYVDIEDNFNLALTHLTSKITPQTKAIIVQHTFGRLVDIKAIRQTVPDQRVKIIADCAHVIIPGKTDADASFFSFGQEKAISTTRGGMVITSDPRLGEILTRSQASLPFPARRAVFRSLLHPILWEAITKTYYTFNLGKIMMVLARAFGLTVFSISRDEARGLRPGGLPDRLANALAARALEQLRKLDGFNKRRLEIAAEYQSRLKNLKKISLPSPFDSPPLRWPILTDQPASLRQFAKKRHIILGNWYEAVIYPKDSDLSALNYSPRSCPNAEALADRVVNLPTYPKMTAADINRVITMLEAYERS